MLAAGVGAAGDVELDLLVEGGEAIFHLGDEPLREGLGFGDGELAELGSGAGDGAAPEGGDVDVEVDGVEFGDECVDAAVGDVGDEDVLGDGGAEVAVAELLGEVGEAEELVAGEAAAEDGGADGGEGPGWRLGGDADVIAVDVVGDLVLLELGGVDGGGLARCG